MNHAAYAVLNSHGEPMVVCATLAMCRRYIATQSAQADCEIRAYPFPPVYDPETGRFTTSGSVA